MLIAPISVLGSGLLGIIGVLLHYLLKQNAQRVDEHNATMKIIAEQGDRLRDHADGLHREAMVAIAKQGDQIVELRREAMAAIAEQGDRLVDLHLQAMAAVAVLGERSAALETKAGWR